MPPVVPTIKSQVTTAPVQRARQSADAPLEAFGGMSADNYNRQNAAVNALGNTVSKILEDEIAKADDARTKEAYANLVTAKNDLFWGEKGAVNRKGANAVSVTEEYGTEFKKTADKIREGLSNDYQRRTFDQMYQKEDTEFHGLLLRHSNSENQAYQKSVTEGVVATTRNDAVLNYATPGKVDESINTQSAALASYLAQQGVAKDQIDAEVAKATGETHFAVMDRMIELGEDMRAQEYLEKVRPQITDNRVLREAERRVESGSRLGTARRMSDEILTKAKDEKEAFDLLKAKNIEDTKLYDAASDRIRSEFAIKTAAVRQRNEQVENDFYNRIEENPASFASIQSSRQWDELGPSQKNALIEKHKRKLEGLDVATDPQTREDLLQLASNPATRDVFLKTSLVGKYSDKLSATEMKEMQKFQAGLRRQDAEALAKLDGILTDDQIVKGAAINVLKLDPGKKSNKEEIAQFKEAVSQRIANESRQKGRKLYDEEKSEIANSMAVKVVTEEGMLWNTRTPLYKVPADQKFRIEIDKLPAGEVLKIRDALKKLGKPVNDENVIMLYKMKYLPTQAGVR